MKTNFFCLPLGHCPSPQEDGRKYKHWKDCFENLIKVVFGDPGFDNQIIKHSLLWLIYCYNFFAWRVRRAHTPGRGSDNPPNANKSPRLAPGCTGWPRSQSCSRSSAGCSGQVRQVRPGCPSGPASRGTRPRAANPSHRPTLGCPPEGPR